jgi:hypothetical protein
MSPNAGKPVMASGGWVDDGGADDGGADDGGIVVCGLAMRVAVDEASDVITGPEGGVPSAMAVLFTTPASTSAWEMVWTALAVQVSDTPGASVVLGQVTAPAAGSLIPTEVRVTVPVLVTRKDQAIVSPKSILPSPFTSVTEADLVSSMAGD